MKVCPALRDKWIKTVDVNKQINKYCRLPGLVGIFKDGRHVSASSAITERSRKDESANRSSSEPEVKQRLRGPAHTPAYPIRGWGQLWRMITWPIQVKMTKTVSGGKQLSLCRLLTWRGEGLMGRVSCLLSVKCLGFFSLIMKIGTGTVFIQKVN